MDNVTRQAIAKALELHIPFAVYRMPDATECDTRFIAELPGHGNRPSDVTFSIVPWNEPSAQRITIHDTFDIDEFLAADLQPHAQPERSIYQHSTTRDEHRAGVCAIVEELKGRPRAKTVLSRIICNDIDIANAANVWVKVAAEYFDRHQHTFRYIYYTPETGGWIGASPELLIDIDKSTGDGMTMALAGTRHRDETAEDWDNKNRDEHDMVTDFIVDTLKSIGIECSVERVDDVKFGHVSHLCDKLRFNTDDRLAWEIADKLSPTPALSGYPRREAIERINRLERHSRGCYGGYVAVETPSCLDAYVNLRCVNFDDRGYRMYVGGGITRLSDPDTEWDETVNKIATLKEIIEQAITKD